jgi:hypothetical protein
MTTPNDVLRSASGPSEMPEILQRAVRDLLGVSEEAAAALRDVGITTVFDLGASNLFASARVAAAHGKTGNAPGTLGLVAGDLLTPGTGPADPDGIGQLPIDRLRLLGAEQAARLSHALDVATIADLANWPPHREARRLVGTSAGGTDAQEDAHTEELRPRFGQYPTERVYYSTLIMFDRLGQPEPMEELNGPLSLRSAVTAGAHTRPAIGALATFEQSWYAQGVTLGHLLHSLSLAPGEATRIAVIDWSRRTSAFAAETIGETEQLDTASTHARALSEVQEAVANDFQEGGSKSSSSSTSSSESEASAGSSGLVNSLFSSGSSSSTSQNASTRGRAESSSWSLGTRSVVGSLTQNVNDRTEQHSSSVRNRRASAVREVAQTEHEQVSTRIVANYNHMHALNLQYYEVVQVYRTEARLHRADRCLFLPMEPLDFGGDAGWAVVERFRGALAAAALNTRIRALLEDDTTAVEIAPAKRVRFPAPVHGLPSRVVSGAVLASRATARVARSAADASPSPDTGASPKPDGASGATTPATGTAPVASPATLQLAWDVDEVARATRLVGRPLFRPSSESLFAPDDTELIGISFDQVAVRTVRIDHVGTAAASDQTFTVPADSAHVDLSPGVRLAELDAIHVTKAADFLMRGSMTLHCAYLGRRLTLPGIPVELLPGPAAQKLVTFTTDQADRRRELQQHLQHQRDYYSQSIFRSLDAATLTFVLGRYQLNGRPLVDQVEPRPIAIAGNYVVLRAPVDDDEDSGLLRNGRSVGWADLLVSRGLDRRQAIDRRLIPIPTGGVFAEAVLGRSNAAEKLDMTRFWHWQDSPIPLQPPEIAAVQTGTRGQAETLTPGQLSAPVLNVLNPTALPDPTGLGAAFNALSTLNFRDMSGLAGTQALLKAAQEGTLAAATDAGKLAAENLKTEANKAVAMGQIAGDIAKAAIAAHAGKKAPDSKGAGGVSGISRDGALINQGRELDKRSSTPEGAARGQSGAGGGAVEGGGTEGGGGAVDGGGGSGGLGGLGGGAVLARQERSHEGEAFDAAVHGPLGASGIDAAEIILAKDTGSGGGGAPPPVSPFPVSLSDAFHDTDQKLKDAFAHAKAHFRTNALLPSGLQSFDDIPLIIAAVNTGGDRPYVAQKPLEMHYSASMLKVAAMYAAYQLRATVNDFAATLGFKVTTEKALFEAISRAFDRDIRKGAPRIQALGASTREARPPQYAEVFAVKKGTSQWELDFSPTLDFRNKAFFASKGDDRKDFGQSFRSELDRMIQDSDDYSTSYCIRALGYSYINGLLAKAGFFSKDSGIWLAGDYTTTFAGVTVNTVNDRFAMQVTNVYQMARLVSLLEDDDLVQFQAAPVAGSGRTMKDLMRGAVTGKYPSMLKRATPPAGFTVELCKIGAGPLKGGKCEPLPQRGCVASEVSVLKHSSGRIFVTCWQNLKDSLDRDWHHIARVIELTMDEYHRRLSTP